MAMSSSFEGEMIRSPLDVTLSAKEITRPENPHLHFLAVQVEHNLQYQHRWTNIKLRDISPITGRQLPRPLISGLPSRRLYVHPEEQQEILKAETERAKITSSDSKQDEGDDVATELDPEYEWVLPTHIREEWSLSRFGKIFAAIPSIPPNDGQSEHGETSKWRKTKRLLMAIVQDDSSIVYYFVHDGIVKPRQN